MIDRLTLLMYASSVYFILIGWVLGSVWRLKLHLGRRIAILFVTCVITPAGFSWYLIECHLERKKKKAAKKRREGEKEGKE